MSGDMREPFPAHPPPLTSRPEGLLSLLGLQTNGRYPQHLSYDKLDASIDLLRWYMEGQATFKTGTINSLSGSYVTDAGGNLTVPAGEHWLLLQFHVHRLTAVAADTGLWLARANSSGTTLVAMSDKVLALTGTRPMVRSTDQYGILLRPSVTLGVVQDNGAGLALDYTLRYCRLQT